MKLIASDCQKNLYDFVFVNFTREIGDADLDKFAIEMTRSNAAHKICRVAYEHLGAYQIVSKDFFNLFNQRDNFINLYQGKNEASIVTQIAHNLFEVFCSLGVAPYIRLDDNDDPVNHKVAKKLVEIFQSHQDITFNKS